MAERAWYEKAGDVWAESTTSPARMGVIGTAIGGGLGLYGVTGKRKEALIDDLLAKDIASTKGKIRQWFAKRKSKELREAALRSPELRKVMLKGLIKPTAKYGALAAVGAAGGRLLHGRATESRLRKGKAWTPSEKRMLKRWENG